MIYSTTQLTGKEYFQVAEHYYAIRDDWFQQTKEEQHLEMCACVAKRRGHLMFNCDSARVIKGIPQLGSPKVTPHCLSDKRRSSDDIQWHYGKLDPNASVVNGFLVVSDIQMICELAATDITESLLVSINYCLHEKLLTSEQLLSDVEDRHGMKGRNRLNRLLHFATPKCESPLETIAMIAIYKAALEMPQQQVVIYDRHRAFVGCVDMYWKIHKTEIILEMDGKSKYRDEQVLFKEKIREDRLRALGYVVIRSNWAEVMNGTLIKKLVEHKIPLRKYSKREFPR